MSASTLSPLLKVDNLSKTFHVSGGLFSKNKKRVYAVDSVSFRLNPGETLGLIGESGCGKTTTGRLVMRLLEADSGSVEFLGRDLLTLSSREMKEMRKQINIIFQDPLDSLNPRLTVGEIVEEPIRSHGLEKDAAKRMTMVKNILEDVGLSRDHTSRYPHEFSGGQRQRIGIARAIALNPKLVVCDEPVSALDVSVQAQIVNLLLKLQKEKGIAFLFISHDLNIVRHISDTIAVMYLGSIVEYGNRDEVFNNPRHPYTRALLSSTPPEHPLQKRRRILLKGEIPSPVNRYPGCAFASRCFMADESCTSTPPRLQPVNDTGDSSHLVSCLKSDQSAAIAG